MSKSREVTPGVAALSGSGWTAVMMCGGRPREVPDADPDGVPSVSQGGTRLRCKRRPFRERY